MRREGVRELLRAAARHDPAGRVRHHVEHQTKGRGRTTIERQQSMSRDARKRRARARAGEGAARDAFGRPQRLQAEPRERDRVTRPPERGEDRRVDQRPRVDERSYEIDVAAPIAIKLGGRLLDRSIDERAASIVERMPHHRRRRDPFETVRRKRERAEER